MAHPPGVGFIGHNGKARRAKEVLRDRTPEIPDRLNRGVLFFFDEGLRVESQELTQATQKGGGAVQANGCLQVRALKRFTEHAAKLAIQADVDFRLGQARHIG
nr:hypothetical protein NCPCFENI_01310 [Cupriavidus sp.]